MINFNENFYGLSLTTWLIMGIILLVILYIVFFHRKSTPAKPEKFKNSNGIPATIYNFNTSWCGWSTKFQPEWEEFTNLVNADPALKNITVMDVKCDNPDNDGKCKEFEVEGFPTVIIEVGNKVGTYKGARTAKDLIETVQGLIKEAAASGVTLVLPTDIVVAPNFAADAPATLVSADSIPSDQMGLDIGPDSAEAFASAIRGCKTVFWNGPMGVFEFPSFANGTKVVAQALTQVSGISVVGGGDSAAAVRALGFADTEFGYISTGGGASLEYLEGKELPGLTALDL